MIKWGIRFSFFRRSMIIFSALRICCLSDSSMSSKSARCSQPWTMYKVISSCGEWLCSLAADRA